MQQSFNKNVLSCCYGRGTKLESEDNTGICPHRAYSQTEETGFEQLQDKEFSFFCDWSQIPNQFESIFIQHVTAEGYLSHWSGASRHLQAAKVCTECAQASCNAAPTFLLLWFQGSCPISISAYRLSLPAGACSTRSLTPTTATSSGPQSVTARGRIQILSRPGKHM